METLPLPTGLTWRSLDQPDLPALVDLSQTCLAADGGLAFLFVPETVQDRFLPPGSRAALGGFDPDGRLAACASVYLLDSPGAPRARLTGQVRPDFRGRGTGTFLLRWSQSQAGALLAGAAGPQKILQVATESLTDPAHRLYRAHGFHSVMEEYVMERDLRQPLPARALPPGVTFTEWQPGLAGQFFTAYHAAFRERPGFPGWSAGEWIEHVTENDHRPDWTLLARAGSEPVGFVIGNIDLTASPPGGYIWQIGVVPDWRRRGLASALLMESVRRMQAGGARSALLAVHVNNPGAYEAYARLGFTTTGRRARYEREL